MSTWGGEAIDLAMSIGIRLDPGQANFIRDAMSEKAGGLWLAPEVADNEPRQNGKSLVLEVRALAGAFLIKEPLIVWTAHEFKTATRSFLAMKEHVTNWDHLRKRVRAIRKSGATTEIELFNPTRVISFLARSGGSGRGFAQVAPLFLDEAFALTPEQMAALLFAMSSHPNPQVWYASSAPLKTSEVFKGIVKRGRKGSSRLVYYEWSASGRYQDLLRLAEENKALPEEQEETEGGRALRERLMRKAAEANRALGYRRDNGTGLSPGSVLTELGAVDAEQFLRERFGVFSDLEEGGKIDPEKWEEVGDPLSRREGDVALAVDISIERDWAGIAMYGLRADGLGHLQLIDYRAGTDWIVSALKELRSTLNPIAVGMARGTYAALKERLRSASFILPSERSKEDSAPLSTEDDPHPPQRGDLIVMNGTDMAAACGSLIEQVRQGTMRHVPADQLTRAVKVAQTRTVGDAQVWVRTDKSVDITGLVACTEAPWVFEARAAVMEQDDYDPLDDLF